MTDKLKEQLAASETQRKKLERILGLEQAENTMIHKNSLDCSAVESVIELVMASSDKVVMVIKSMIPVGYTKRIRAKCNTDRIIFSPEFLRESRALYDNLYPSIIIVGCDEGTRAAAEIFAALLQKGAEKPANDTLFMGFTEAEAVKLFAIATCYCLWLE